MAKTFQLEIIATDRIFFRGECEHLVITAIDGLLGIMAGHEPLVTVLPTGELKYMVDGVWKYAAISEGFIQVMPDKAVILADLRYQFIGHNSILRTCYQLIITRSNICICMIYSAVIFYADIFYFYSRQHTISSYRCKRYQAAALNFSFL